jgi:hypothetical protein
MALQIRRGLEADRLSITPLEGELLYVTDTGNVYIGDGTTAGGALVTGDVVDDTSPALGGDLNLNGNDIIGTGNINITGTITATGNINLGDASADDISVLGSLTTSITPKIDSAVDVGSPALRWRNGYFAGLTVNGQIDAISINSRLIADDSTISFDPTSGVFDGTFVGNVTGNTAGIHTGSVVGTLDGDVTGSVFGDDSTLIIDGINNTVTSTTVNTSIINMPTSDTLTVNSTLAGRTVVKVEAEENPGIVNLVKTSTSDISGSGAALGRIAFTRDDINGAQDTALIAGSNGYIAMSVDGTGAFTDPSTFLFWTGVNLGVGTNTPGDTLDVRGGGVFTGTVDAASFKGSLVTDASTTIIDAVNGSLLVANVDIVGTTGNTPADTGTVDSWLEVSVNGATKYIPLYD